MKPPTVVFKSTNAYSFRIRYRQIAHRNRFFFVDLKYHGRHQIKGWQKGLMIIEKMPENIPSYYIFGFLNLISERRKFDDFMVKVKQYDIYLDTDG